MASPKSARAAIPPGVLAWIGICVVVWGVLGALYARVPPSPDQAVFDYLGWTVVQGDPLYVGGADRNWPGAILLHAASNALFGNQLWSWRVFDFGWMLVGLLVLRAFAKEIFGSTAANLVLVVYPVMYVTSTGWFAGQRDVVAAPLLLVACLGAFRRMRRGGARWSAVEGLGLGLATLIRPTFAVLGIALAVFDLVWGRHRDRSLVRVIADQAVAASVAFGVLGLTWVLLPPESRAGWVDFGIRFNLEVDAWESGSRSTGEALTTQLAWAVRCWHWYLAFAVAAAALGFRSSADRRPLGLLLLVLGVVIVSVGAQGQPTAYHLGPALPILGVLVSGAVGSSLGTLRRRPWKIAPALVAALVCLVAAAGLAKKVQGSLGTEARWYLGQASLDDVMRRYSGGLENVSTADLLPVADYLRERVPAGGTALFWGPSILPNTLAERRSPTRFVSFVLVTDPTPDFALYEDWRGEFERSLEERPPVVVLLIQPSGQQRPGFLDDERRGFMDIVARLLKEGRYRPGPRFGPVVSWERDARHDFRPGDGP